MSDLFLLNLPEVVRALSIPNRKIHELANTKGNFNRRLQVCLMYFKDGEILGFKGRLENDNASHRIFGLIFFSFIVSIKCFLPWDPCC